MPKAPGFKPCGSRSKPMPTGNPHDSCLKRLGESHQADKCRICKGFCPWTKKEWDFRLKQLLMEAALSPQPPVVCQDPAPSTLVHSAPAAAVGAAPRLESERDPQHRRTPAPQPTSSARCCSHSPGQKQHQKPEKGGPPPQRPASLEPPVQMCPTGERLGAQPTVCATLTPALRGEPLSPVPLDSLTHSVVEVQLPSTPDAFCCRKGSYCHDGIGIPSASCQGTASCMCGTVPGQAVPKSTRWHCRLSHGTDPVLSTVPDATCSPDSALTPGADLLHCADHTCGAGPTPGNNLPADLR
ncbi:hypothetical protein UY3_15144 [Chelonia mydas]|uniref:Uncharacterized protein n=1 Tax=Chelonia mydas TaxID=8469 RepID=M7BHN5_CHEMY|nr:hypothetical protein UY3_15144 [Chelonia mydas]